MIIPTLGNGQLYRVNRFRYQMLTAMERARAYKCCCWLFAVILINALYWILR